MVLIEPAQSDVLRTFLQKVSREVSGFRNLLFVHDDDLFGEDRIEFVNRHDPDIILNFSNCDESLLRRTFRTPVRTDDAKLPWGLYGTALRTFRNVPLRYRPYYAHDTVEVPASHFPAALTIITCPGCGGRRKRVCASVRLVGRPLMLTDDIVRTVEREYRKNAVNLFEEMLATVTASTLRSEEKLRAALQKAFAQESKGRYSFDVGTGKLTVIYKTAHGEIKGDFNAYALAAKIAVATGATYWVFQTNASPHSVDTNAVLPALP